LTEAGLEVLFLKLTQLLTLKLFKEGMNNEK